MTIIAFAYDKVKNNALMSIIGTAFILTCCEPNKQSDSSIQEQESNDLTSMQIADSVEFHKNNENASFDTTKVVQLFAQPLEVKQSDFRAADNLSYFLPLSIKNTSNRRVKGVVFERTGMGISGAIYVGKFVISILPKKTVKMRLTLRELNVKQQELFQTDGLNSAMNMNIRVSQVIYSDGEIQNVNYLDR